jgi:hypothetical protein
VRTYVVQPGDTPAKIASRAEFAGCPKCAVDLIRANPHKPHVRLPNGFLTFRALVAGERLRLPDKWFSPEFERLPPAYFRALPSADGVTPSTLGDAAAGVLGDFQALDAASARVAAMAGMADAAFSAAVGDAGTAINQAAREAYGSANAVAAARAKDAQDGTQWAWQRNGELATALASGDAAGATRARLDIQNALTTALGNARLALEALYAQGAPAAAAPRPRAHRSASGGAGGAWAGAEPLPTAAQAGEPAAAGMSLGAMFGIGLLAAGALVGAAYLARSRAPRESPARKRERARIERAYRSGGPIYLRAEER